MDNLTQGRDGRQCTARMPPPSHMHRTRRIARGWVRARVGRKTRMEETAMAKTRGTGLLMVWTDIDAEFEAEFNRWYDEEHISRLLEVPGFLSAGRYTAIRGGPKYLAMYELEDHNVLRSAAYLDIVKYQPSPQRTKIGTSRVGRNFLRNLYRQILPVHTDPIEQTVEI